MALRMTGVFSPAAFAALGGQAQPRAPAMALPSFGFAAQGAQYAAAACDASACTEDAGSSGTPATSSANGSDAECAPSGDPEGVISTCTHGPSHAPPWPFPGAVQRPQRADQQQSKSPLGDRSNWQQQQQQQELGPAASPLLASSSCIGVVPASAAPLRRLGAAFPAFGSRLYGTQARAPPTPERDDQDAAASEAPLGRHAHVPRQHKAARSVAPESGPEPAVERLSAAEFRAKHSIFVEDADSPEPFQAFSDAPFPPAVMDVLEKYTSPSAIQSQAWPVALAGRDLVAIASTGSGKTMGYLLPALLHIQSRAGDPALGPSVLVLAPTRELAQQIEAEAHRFARLAVPEAAAQGRQGRKAGAGSGLRTLCLYGGASRGAQGAGLRRQPHLLIATPGRLLDFATSGELQLNQVSYMVLDEADRMLDMGFEPQLAEVSRLVSPARQTLFFSATWPEAVRAVAGRFARHQPVTVFIGNVGEKPVAATSITQQVQLLRSSEDKLPALQAYLRTMILGEGAGAGAGAGGARQGRAIVFCKTKASCDRLAMMINRSMPFEAATLHGDKTQMARDFALSAFRSGRVPVLVATDVAARGLDVPAINAVVNFDMPQEIEMYVHRIGRTGRAGASGHALSFLTSRDSFLARDLVGVLEGAGQEVPDDLREMAKRPPSTASSGGRGRGGGSGGGARRGGYQSEYRGGSGGHERGGGGGGYDGEGYDGGGGGHGGHKHADDWRHGGGGGGGGRKAAYGKPQDY